MLIRILTILSTVTASVLVAAIVAATFAPFVLALRNRGWSRIKAAAAVFLGAAAVIIATLAIIALAFLPYIKDVVADLHAGIAAVKTLLADYNLPPEVASAVENADERRGGVAVVLRHRHRRHHRDRLHGRRSWRRS